MTNSYPFNTTDDTAEMLNYSSYIHLHSYNNRSRIERTINELMDELFTLEFQDTSEMSVDMLEIRKRKIQYITYTIDKQKDLLAKIPLAPIKPQESVVRAVETKKEEGGSALGFVIVWLIMPAIIVGLFYINKTNVEELRELETLTNTQRLLNEHQVTKIKELKEQVTDLTNKHNSLEESHKDLQIHDGIVTAERDKLQTENAIAWRWYDRHTAKISKLEKTIEDMTANSVEFGGATPIAFCVAQYLPEYKTVRCLSSKTAKEYIIHFNVAPKIAINDVLRVNNIDQTVDVVGKNTTYKITKIFEYFNDTDPYSKVDALQ